VDKIRILPGSEPTVPFFISPPLKIDAIEIWKLLKHLEANQYHLKNPGNVKKQR